MRYDNATTTSLEPHLRELLAKNWSTELNTFSRGIFLTGSTGVGKTYALHAIHNNVLDRETVAKTSVGRVENWVDLLFELKDRISKGGIRDFINDNIIRRSFVFIDDVGAEKQTEWSHEMLYLIVNRLYESQKPLFITTNLSAEEFTAKYGERLVSRIAEMCSVLELTGEDKRIN